MPKLIISGTAHELAEELITIGRAPENAIVIDDPSVSSRHAQLELSGETYRLKDLESTNGTRVNGIPIMETVLRFDDRIRFGGVEARFEPDTRGSQPLPQPEKIEAKPAESSPSLARYLSILQTPLHSRAETASKTPLALSFLVSRALLYSLSSAA